MQKVKDLTNQTFNHLTAIKYVGKDNNNKSLWLFRCDCGKEKVIRGTNVSNGYTKSCGCRVRNKDNNNLISKELRARLIELTKKNQGNALRKRKKPYKNNKSGYSGIFWSDIRKRYSCRITYNGKNYYKTCKTIEEAKKWIENKRKELYNNATNK